MNFSRPTSRRPAEPALPMINVVFLLLIFFLMSAQMAPPPPFAVSSPEAEADGQASGEHSIYVGADGSLAFLDARGEEVWLALTDVQARDQATLLIRADAGLSAVDLAQLLSKISPLGFGEVLLVTSPR